MVSPFFCRGTARLQDISKTIAAAKGWMFLTNPKELKVVVFDQLATRAMLRPEITHAHEVPFP
jgi:hypothetical protein